MAGRGLYRHPPQPQSQDPRRHTGLLFAPAAGAYNAVTGNPTTATVTFACGFEDAAITTNWGAVGGPVLDTTIAGRTGDKAARIDVTADTTLRNLVASLGAARSVTVVTLRFRVSAIPTATSRLFTLSGTSFYNPTILIYNDGTLGYNNGGTAPDGPVIVPNQWYTIDLATDGLNKLGKWSVDGVAQTDPGPAANVDTHGDLYLGKSNAIDGGAFSYYFDDVAVSKTWADYPLSPGVVRSGTEAWIEPDGITTSDSISAIKTINRTASDTVAVGLSYASTVVADTPVAYWQLGEASGNPQDSSGNARHVTVVGGTPTYGQTGPVIGTTAIAFDGSTEYFTAPSGIDVADVFTMEAWVIPGATGASRGIINLSDGQYLRILNTGELSLNQESVGIIVKSTVNPSAGVWNHVVATKNGATVKLYINGVDRTGTVTNLTFVSFAAAAHIGEGNGTERFNGSMGQAAVYNYALTATQVAEHYNVGSDGAATTKNLVRTASDAVTTSDTFTRPYSAAVLIDTPLYYWRLGEPSGAVVNSGSTGSGSNGTTTGTVTRDATGLIATAAGDDGAIIPTAASGYVSGTLNAALPNVLSIEAWLKVPASGTTFLTAFSTKGAISNLSFGIDRTGGTHELRAYIYNGTSYEIVARSNTGVIAAGGTYHIVLTRASSTATTANQKFYINGVDQSSGTLLVSRTVTGADTTFYIGGFEGTTETWSDTIDEVAIYSTVLTAQEVEDHYNAGSAGGPQSLSRSASDTVTTSETAQGTKALVRTASDTVGLSYAPAVTTDSPIAYWRLGEPSGTTAVAEVGPNGTYQNTPTLGVTGLLTGDANTAVTFDQASAEAVGISTGMPAGSSVGASVEMWLDTAASLPAFEIWTLWSRGDIAGPAHTLRYRRWDDATTSLLWLFWDGSATQAVTATDHATHTAGLAGRHHVVVVHDYAGQTVKGYIDGVLAGTGSAAAFGTPVAPAANAGSRIAGYMGNDSTMTPATIDEVAVYDLILTPTQILEHYTAGSNGVAATKNLVRSASDTVTLSSTVRVTDPRRTASDTVTITSPVAGGKNLVRTAADTITLTSPVARTGTFVRSASDTVTLSSTVARTGSFARTAADTVTLSSTVDSLEGYVRTASDTVTISSAANPVVTGGAQSLNRTAGDTLSFGAGGAGVFQASIFQASIFQTGGGGGGDEVDAVVFAPRTAADTATISSTLTRTQTLVRSASDSVTITSTAARTVVYSRTVADSVTTSDAVAGIKSLNRTASDAVTLASAVNRVASFARTVADAVTTSDAVAGIKSLIRTASDAVTTTSTAARTGTFARTASDTVTISTSLDQDKTTARTVADTVTLASTVARTGTFTRSATDGVSTSDNVDQDELNPRSLTDAVTLSSTVARTTSLVRSATDAVTTSDTTVETGTFTRTAADTVTLASTVETTEATLRSVADSVTTSDAITEIGSFARSAADTATLASTVASTKTTSRTAADTVTLTSPVARIQTLVRSAADAVTTADTTTETGTFTRTAADTVTVSTSVSATAGAVAGASDSVTISSSVSRTLTAVRSASDSVTTTDSASQVRAIIRSASDSVTTSDSASRTGTFARTAADAITTSDSVVKAAAKARTASDTVTLATTAVRTASLPRTAADAVTTSDTATKVGSFPRTATDAVTTTSTAVKALATSRTASDAVTTSATTIETGTFSRTAADTVTVSTAVAGAAGAQALLNDSVTTSDTVSRTQALSRSASDTVTLASVAAQTRSIVRSASDTVTVASTVSRAGTYTRTGADTVTLATSVARTASFARTAADAVTTSDQVNRVGTFTRVATDTLTVSTSVSGITGTSSNASDTVTVATTVARTVAVQRSAADAVTLSSAVARTKSVNRTASDTVTLASTAAATIGEAGAASDAVTISTTVSASVVTPVVNRSAVDAVSVSDQVPVDIALTRTASDAVSTSDQADAHMGQDLFRTAEDLVHFSSTLGRPGRRGHITSDLTLGPDGRIGSSLERRNIPSSLRNGKIPAEVS